jgi:hypothetical protein
VTDAPLDVLRELTGLEVEEVIGVDATPDRLDELNRQFLLYFPDHAHVIDELATAWAGRWPDPDVIVHAWLLQLDGQPVGFALVHTSLRRQILLQHFIGMDPQAGARLPLRWVGYFMDALRDTAVFDCERAGTVLLGQMGEHHEEHLRAWSRFGYVTLDVDYREPNHGRQWSEHGDPSFFPMTPQLRVTDAGASRPFSDVATRALEGFLLDHYLLPADEPTVVRTLTLAAELPD